MANILGTLVVANISKHKAIALGNSLSCQELNEDIDEHSYIQLFLSARCRVTLSLYQTSHFMLLVCRLH